MITGRANGGRESSGWMGQLGDREAEIWRMRKPGMGEAVGIISRKMAGKYPDPETRANGNIRWDKSYQDIRAWGRDTSGPLWASISWSPNLVPVCSPDSEAWVPGSNPISILYQLSDMMQFPQPLCASVSLLICKVKNWWVHACKAFGPGTQ